MMSYFATPPLQIIDLPADDRHTGGTRSVSTIKYIILHTTEGRDSRAWLSTSPHSVVSVHRLIQRTHYNAQTRYGGHYKILADDKIANHAGSGRINRYGPEPGKVNLNRVTLSAELERYAGEQITEYQYRECASMCVEWWGRYGFLPILRHQDVDPTRRSDPVNFDWGYFSTCLRDALVGCLAGVPV